MLQIYLIYFTCPKPPIAVFRNPRIHFVSDKFGYNFKCIYQGIRPSQLFKNEENGIGLGVELSVGIKHNGFEGHELRMILKNLFCLFRLQRSILKFVMFVVPRQKPHPAITKVTNAIEVYGFQFEIIPKAFGKISKVRQIKMMKKFDITKLYF